METPLPEFEIENSMRCEYSIKIYGKYVQVKTIVTEETLLERIYNFHYSNGVPAMFTS